jgi:hypothetical protein
MSRLVSAHFLRKLRSSRYWSRNGIILGYLLLMTLMIPRSLRLGFQYEIGKPWQEADLEAPFDFAIYKSPDSVAAEKEAIAAQVMDIYRLDSTRVKQSRDDIEEQVTRFMRLVDNLRLAQKNKDSARVSSQLTLLNRDFPGIPLIPFPDLSPAVRARLLGRALGLANAAHVKGYVTMQAEDTSRFISLRTAPAQERYAAVPQLINGAAQLRNWVNKQLAPPLSAEDLLMRFVSLKTIKPNYVYAESLTEEARQWRKSMVSPVYDLVEEDDKIISKDEIVDRETYAKLTSLEREMQKRFGEQDRRVVFLAQFLIIGFITFILLTNLRVTRPRIFFSNTKLSLILFTMMLAVAGMVMATKLTDVAVRLIDILGPNINLSYLYLAPACIVPIFISSFFEHRLGFLCNILVALYGAVLVQQGLEYAFVQTMAGTVAVYNLRRLRKRERFFYTLGYIFVAYSVSYIVYSLLIKGSFSAVSYHTLLLFAINVAITMIAYNLIYLLERVFGETSDLTYLELLDTNHPLLQELARKAPGTFQHSLQVANIAEATINEIGGNALLVHVGALYHDIGKMPHANYFIENMGDGDKKRSPHQKLSCLESAEIIIGHVKKGVDLAHKYHLPREIVQFIETHHGTTRVEYFYRVYLQMNQCVEEEADNLFRYPGPLPFSKETAVLMIADSVEAASRAMKGPTAEKLKELVDGIIDHKIKDGQLENSNLTFKDIANLRRVIKKQMLSIYHGRIEYPAEAVKAPASPS